VVGRTARIVGVPNRVDLPIVIGTLEVETVRDTKRLLEGSREPHSELSLGGLDSGQRRTDARLWGYCSERSGYSVIRRSSS
jgi:hypothetical protein